MFGSGIVCKNNSIYLAVYVGVGGCDVSSWASVILHMVEIPLMRDILNRRFRFFDVSEFEGVAS